MFREVARTKQRMTEQECIELLKTERRGVLSVLGDDGYPYGLPINHWYCPENGQLYFHSGKKGHKVDALQRSDKVSYCVYDAGTPDADNWSLHRKSVIVFGRMHSVEDEAEAMEIVTKLSLQFTDDRDYIEREIEKLRGATLVFELIPAWITGKRVHEA